MSGPGEKPEFTPELAQKRQALLEQRDQATEAGVALAIDYLATLPESLKLEAMREIKIELQNAISEHGVTESMIQAWGNFFEEMTLKICGRLPKTATTPAKATESLTKLTKTMRDTPRSALQERLAEFGYSKSRQARVWYGLIATWAELWLDAARIEGRTEEQNRKDLSKLFVALRDNLDVSDKDLAETQEVFYEDLAAAIIEIYAKNLETAQNVPKPLSISREKFHQDLGSFLSQEYTAKAELEKLSS